MLVRAYAVNLIRAISTGVRTCVPLPYVPLSSNLQDFLVLDDVDRQYVFESYHLVTKNISFPLLGIFVILFYYLQFLQQ